MNLRKYLVPEFVIGDNALQLVGRYANNYLARKILIVTDPNIIKAGWLNEVTESLDANDLSYVIFDEVTPNPKDYEVAKGAEIYKKEQCTLLIAIGGGSVMDCAKGIGIVHSNKADITSFEGVDKVTIPMPPLICIPTTAGSSADISQFAIIINAKENRKFAIISKSVVPDISLLDAVCTTSMDLELTAATGMDALVHAIEAYVSNASSPVTDHNALRAMELISGNLLKVMEEPNNMVYRNELMLGSLMAGMAFSNASLGLVHAMAHSMGGLLDLAHGECNAILLEHCVDYNYDSAPDRYNDIYRVMNGNRTNTKENLKEELIQSIIELRESLQIKIKIDATNIDDKQLDILAQNAYNDPCLATNPKKISVAQIKAIYERIF